MTISLHAVCGVFPGCGFGIFYYFIVRTTGLAGGLLTPYKGLLPALESKDSLKSSPAATSFTQGSPMRSSYFFCFTGSPVNGSIYSLSVIWSYSQSSFNWFWIYSCTFFAFFPTVSTYGRYILGKQANGIVLG
jgi:hypothetical protein